MTCFSEHAISDLYSWTDENGNKHYTTSPPPRNVSATVTPITHVEEKTIKSEPTPESQIHPKTKDNQLTEEQKKEIDQEIQESWNGMWDALKKGEIDKASEYVTPDSRQNYKEVFKALSKPKSN